MDFQDLEKLPSPPGVAVKLLELFSSPDVSLDDLTNVISVDPTLTARIVKYANSPMFARRHEASSLRQAITMLGANGVKMIALSFSLTEIKAADNDGSFNFDQFWNASLATAVCAQNIYSAAEKDADTGFLIGLLSNVGQLALYCNSPEDYEAAMNSKSVYDLELLRIEQEVFQENRYRLGADVLKAWNFPDMMVEALLEFADPANRQSFDSRALELANRLSYAFLSESPDYEIVKTITADVAELSGQEPDESEAFFATTIAAYAEIASVLSYDCPQKRSLKEIELEAKTKILELTMDLHIANTQVTAENSELKDMAYIDALTRLGNRRQYDSIAGAELSRCARLRNSFGLMVADIDHFKSVNDTYGHAAGDEILTEVAKRLKSCLRKYDYVFRFGGEEFVIILPESTEDICSKVAERLRVAIEEKNFQFEEQEISITISIGGSVYCAGDAADLDILFQQADEALYVAKKSGRNRYELHDKHASPKPIVPSTGNDSAIINSPNSSSAV